MFSVILNEVKNPTEELTIHIPLTLVVGYFADAQYDRKSPIVGVADTSPTRRTRPFCRYRDISPVSTGEFTPKEEARFVFAREAKRRSKLPGGWVSAKYMH